VRGLCPSIVFFITMNAIVAKLYRLIGIQYEYKLEFQAFLEAALAAYIVADTNVTGNTPTIRQGLVDTFIGCGPSMGFEAKRAAYGALELITEAIAADDDVSAGDAATLNALLINTTRFVGLAEGDGEDYHFMVATYNLAKEIARILDETVIYGSIATLTLTTAGSGIVIEVIPPVEPETEPTIVDTGEDVVFVASSTESSDPANYADATVEAEVIDGEIDSITLISNGGEGFFVGQVIELTLDTTAAGQETGSQATPATATVTSIID
jgi:hypothetical protein